MRTQSIIKCTRQFTAKPRENGQGLIEYSLIIAIIALGTFIVLMLVGPDLGDVFSQIVNNFEEEENPGHIVVDVVDAEGEGVPNVRVYAFNGARRYTGNAGRTDENGRLIFEDLADGDYQFRANYRRNKYWSNLISWQDQWHATVETGERPFTVQVIDQAGQGINNVRVYAFTEERRYIGLYGNTDQNGNLILNLPEGNYSFRANYRRHEFWSDTVNSPAADNISIATGQQSFTVNVVDTAGQGIDNVRVYAFNNADQYIGLYANSDSSGQAIIDLPNGSYKFRADYRRSQYWSHAVDTPASDNVTIQTGERPFTVYVITDNGGGIENVRVYAFTDSDRYVGLYANTDGTGTALFNLPDGSYKFRADYRSSHYWSNPVNTPDAGSTTIETGQRPFTINVVDAAGTGIANVRVYAFTSADRYIGLSLNTDSNGQGTFDLPAGSFKFRADYRSNRYWSTVINSPETTSAGINTGQRTLSVRVTDDGGTGLDNVHIYAFTGADRYTGVNARTDATGTTTIALPDGTYKIRANYGGGRYWSSPFSAADTAAVTIVVNP